MKIFMLTVFSVILSICSAAANVLRQLRPLAGVGCTQGLAGHYHTPSWGISVLCAFSWLLFLTNLFQ